VDAVTASTLLFTDIEGSTTLWERHGEAMRRALRLHDDVVRECVERCGGAIVKATGDGFLAVFPSSPDALKAVIAFQQRLSSDTAADLPPLRVRCGLDFGPVDARAGDVFGLHVSRAARVMDAAHGGQVLLTESVAADLEGRLPDDVSLRDLGSVRLRGIAAAVRVFQLAHPALRCEFPPLRHLEETPHNLPNPLTSFVGRAAELRDVADMLARHRLVTLLGMGGLGKTRLALRIARDALDRFPDGVWFVDLSPVRDPALVPVTIAQAFSLREEGAGSILDTLGAWLRPRTVLAVIDNCEHLVDAVADAAAALLQRAPSLRILATSREALRVDGEQIYAVAPLPLPHSDAEDALGSTAAQLFVDRLRLQRPDFRPTAADALHIVDICRRVEGIPLALEIAAARANSLSLADISSRLRDRLRFLARGHHRGQERQRTMRALVAWSFDLLDPHCQTLFARLSVFAGGFDLEAAQAVCAATPVEREAIDDLLAILVDKSLVQCDGTGATARYHMLETLRDYAAERLAERGESEVLEQRHFHFYFEFAKEASRGLRERSQAAWLRRLELEHDTIRAALKLQLSPRGDPILAVKLEVALQGFWVLQGYAGEGRQRIRETLALCAVREHPTAHGHALYLGGVLAWAQGDYPEAIDLLERCVRLRRDIGNETDIAAALSSLGVARVSAGDPERAREPENEALRLFRTLGDRVGEAIVLAQLAQISFELQDDAEALRLSAESSRVAQEVGHLELEAEGERTHAQVALASGDGDEALRRCERSLQICSDAGSRRDEAVSRALIGKVHLVSGEAGAARRELAIAVRALRDLELNAELVHALEDCAMLARHLNRPRESAALLAAVESARGRLGARRSARSREQWNATLADARNTLGSAFERAWAEGCDLSLRDASDLALSGVLAVPA
jgi:predicted ATPase/class 3 adenylate cyclase